MQFLKSLSNNCHWTLIIDTAILELFEPAPNDYDFHLYNRLKHDTRQQNLSISAQSFAPEKLPKIVSIATTTPPKYILAFNKKSSFDVEAVSRRKHDQKIPAIFKILERVHHRKSGLFPFW